MCGGYGLSEVRGAGMLAAMGECADLIDTTLSGLAVIFNNLAFYLFLVLRAARSGR